MKFSQFRVIAVGAALFLPACSFSMDDLWPSLTGEDPGQQTTETATAAPAAQPAKTDTTAQSAPPPLGTTSFEPTGVTQGADTGTFVGKKVVELRGELGRLQNSISVNNGRLQELRAIMVQNSQVYHGTVSAVNTRLQVGTTPGNPILVQQFNAAQSTLDRLASDITEMNQLANGVAADSTMSAYLSESTRAAFGVSGAVDEDHAQLAILEDEVNRTVVLIERLLKEITDDLRRQTNYVASERSNLNLLATGIKSGEIYGASLINSAMASAGAGATRATATDTTGRRPLVVIRFDKPNVPFEQALYNAVRRVLERRPDATFDLVAVAPAAGGPATVALNSNKARRYSESVLRALTEMGLPPTRVAVSAKTSGAAKANEIHLYLR